MYSVYTLKIWNSYTVCPIIHYKRNNCKHVCRLWLSVIRCKSI